MNNEKIVLWKMNFYKKDAYKDQYGVPHEAIVVEEEILATIVEYKTLPVAGSKYSTTFATKAETENGRVFLLPNDWGSDWCETNSDFEGLKGEFKDAIKEFNKRKMEESRLPEDGYMKPLIRKNGDLAIPPDVEKCTCQHFQRNYGEKYHYYYKPNGHCDYFFLKES